MRETSALNGVYDRLLVPIGTLRETIQTESQIGDFNIDFCGEIFRVKAKKNIEKWQVLLFLSILGEVQE